MSQGWRAIVGGQSYAMEAVPTGRFVESVAKAKGSFSMAKIPVPAGAHEPQAESAAAGENVNERQRWGGIEEVRVGAEASRGYDRGVRVAGKGV